MKLFPELEAFFAARETETHLVPQERHTSLRAIVDVFLGFAAMGADNPQILVCTHNSRRSQMSQMMSIAMRARYDVKPQVFSAGTEATAVHPNTIKALEKVGFRLISKEGPAENPRYLVAYSDEAPPVTLWSKTLDDPSLPERDFLALMTCDEAFEACPEVPGALGRVRFSFPDPKVSDGTPEAEQVYYDLAVRMGREGCWLGQEHQRLLNR